MAEPLKSESKKTTETIETIKKMNLGQINELVESLKKEFNIKEEVVAQPTATAQTSEKPEEKKSAGTASVKLLEMKEGLNKIKIYQIIMNAVNKELKNKGEETINIVQAKKITEKEDKIILENVSNEEAKDLKKKLEEEGGDKIKVEIK